jgi:hypothetical protein
MKITEMILMLSKCLEQHGDIEVVMQATTLPDGFNQSSMGSLPDVFESTVESYTVEKESLHANKRIRLWWQV